MGNIKLAAVIPTYKASSSILKVVSDALSCFDLVIVVDDCCPEMSGKLVNLEFSKVEKVEVVFNERNLGVGGATKIGFQRARELNSELMVKIDADGQMDLSYLSSLLEPIYKEDADFTKGNRFGSRQSLSSMPWLRILGNSALTLLNRFSTGSWNVSDPTNGFICLSRAAFDRISWEKISNRYLFETELLFRASMANLRILDVPMPAIYRDEISGLAPLRLIFPLLWTHSIQYHKRVLLQYFIREMNAGTIYLVAGVPLFWFGIVFGISNWIQSSSSGVLTSAGTVSISTISIVLGFQLLLQFTTFDTSQAKSKQGANHRF